MSKGSVLAIGLGFKTKKQKKKKSEINYFKTFTQHEKNHDAVKNFLDILVDELAYKSGNALISLKDQDFDYLSQIFTDAGHSDTADFMNAAKKNYGAFICIMIDGSTTSNQEEEYLAIQLGWKGQVGITKIEPD